MGGKYELYYDTIGAMLTQIARGQLKHDFAIIPEIAYADWKKLATFSGEESKYVTGKDGVRRKFTEAKFEDSGHIWVIVVTECKHPNSIMGNCWRFIVQITKDGKEISHSRIDIEAYNEYVN